MLCALAREHGILKLLEAECAHQDERTAPDALPKRQRTLAPDTKIFIDNLNTVHRNVIIERYDESEKKYELLIDAPGQPENRLKIPGMYPREACWRVVWVPGRSRRCRRRRRNRPGSRKRPRLRSSSSTPSPSAPARRPKAVEAPRRQRRRRAGGAHQGHQTHDREGHAGDDRELQLGGRPLQPAPRGQADSRRGRVKRTKAWQVHTPAAAAAAPAPAAAAAAPPAAPPRQTAPSASRARWTAAARVQARLLPPAHALRLPRPLAPKRAGPALPPLQPRGSRGTTAAASDAAPRRRCSSRRPTPSSPRPWRASAPPSGSGACNMRLEIAKAPTPDLG